MDDSQSESLWSHLRNVFRRDNGESPLAKAIREAKGEGDLPAEDADMLLNVLRLADMPVEDAMVPRADMVCAELTSPLDEVAKLFVEHGHSRMPVYKEDKDNIVGLVYVKDLLPTLLPHLIQGGDDGTPELRDILRPVLFVPENKNIRAMLRDFLARGTHMAIVLDSYGGTAGLVTLEDVLEEIVGDLPDGEGETNGDEELSRQISENEYLLDGALGVHEWADVFGQALTAERVSTVSGFVTALLGRVPRVGDEATYRNLRFVVESVRGRRAGRIRVLRETGDAS